MKRDLICRADQLHAALEVFFRENEGWEDAFISFDKDGVYAARINWDEECFDIKTVYRSNIIGSST